MSETKSTTPGNKAKREHWERIYREKGPDEVSWTQNIPSPSLQFVDALQLPKNARIIDVGGGDSKLVDHLLERGFQNLSVLDISEAALQKAKARLGERAEEVNWIVSDVLEHKAEKPYDLWHDRATFHFLTDPERIREYVDLVERSTSKGLLIATFSDRGPEKCSGLPVEQYDEEKMDALFSKAFRKHEVWREVHVTPDGKEQEFLFYTALRKE